MEKVIMLTAVVTALVSCQLISNKNSDAESSLVEVKTTNEAMNEIYSGTLPAASVLGIKYVLTLNATINDTDTTYTLDMTYLDAEGKGKDKTFTSKGKQQNIRHIVNKQPKAGIKLTPDNGEAPIYFLVVNDSTLRLVDNKLHETNSSLNYDVIKVKH